MPMPKAAYASWTIVGEHDAAAARAIKARTAVKPSAVETAISEVTSVTEAATPKAATESAEVASSTAAEVTSPAAPMATMTAAHFRRHAFRCEFRASDSSRVAERQCVSLTARHRQRDQRRSKKAADVQSCEAKNVLHGRRSSKPVAAMKPMAEETMMTMAVKAMKPPPANVRGEAFRCNPRG